MNGYLLDSHIFLWWSTDPTLITSAVKLAVGSGRNAVWVSAASVWELSIKQQKGKLNIVAPVEDILLSSRFSLLHISLPHITTAARLSPIHGDPFDRMLVAQAQVEKLTLITRDPDILRYNVQTLAA